MSYTAGVFLLVAAVIIAIGAVLQVSQYARGRHIISRGQLILRLVTAALLMLSIALIFLGVTGLRPVTPVDALKALVLWAAVVLLLIGAIVLAMIDLRMVERTRHLRQAEIYRAIQELQDRAARGGKQ